MARFVFGILYFLIFILLPYILPAGIFCYGAYLFFAQGKYIGAAIFLIMAIGILLMLLLRRYPLSAKKIVWLKANGQKIMTEFVSLDRRWNFRINGEPPYVISSRAKGRTFKSDNLWPSGSDDTFYINDGSSRALETLQKKDANTIYLIPVYIHPSKAQQYYMDLDAMEVKQ